MPAFLLNPYVIAGTIAFFGLTSYWNDQKGSVIDDGIFIIPGPGDPNYVDDKKSGILNYFDTGFTEEKKGLLGLSILAIVLYSKPWK